MAVCILCRGGGKRGHQRTKNASNCCRDISVSSRHGWHTARMAQRIEMNVGTSPSITARPPTACLPVCRRLPHGIFSVKAPLTCPRLSPGRGQPVAFNPADQTHTTPSACFPLTVGRTLTVRLRPVRARRSYRRERRT